MRTFRPDLSKLTYESAKRVRAYQRNKLYPIYLALSGASDQIIRKKAPDFINRLNELIVSAAISEKDERNYHFLVRMFKSRKKLTHDKKVEAIKIVQTLLKRMKRLTIYVAQKVKSG